MAHYEPPHQDLRCLRIQLFASLVVEELKDTIFIRKRLVTFLFSQVAIIACIHAYETIEGKENNEDVLVHLHIVPPFL